MRDIIVNGRIAADVTRQISKQGSEFISFSIANSEFGDPKSSDGVVQTTWFRVTAFDSRLVNLAQYLKKGKPITVFGRYSNRLYQSQKTGQYGISNDIIATEINFELGSEHRGEGQSNTTSSNGVSVDEAMKKGLDEIPQATSRKMVNPTPKTETPAVNATADDDDDLPF